MCRRVIVTAALCLLLNAASTNGLDSDSDEFKNPHFVQGREGIVHLFEWKWTDIADECERFLGPKGYAGVQTSPVTENLILPSRPWHERHQPISYRWKTRSGNERQFRDMVKRCNKVGVRIYVELILNHMTTDNVTEVLGTGGSPANVTARYYPDVPYNTKNFNTHCDIEDPSNVTQLRNCRVFAHDLNQNNPYVIWKIVRLMDELTDAGVAGFRIDMAAFMWPEHLKNIYSRVKSLNANHGFPNNSRPYIYQAISLDSSIPVSKYEYNSLAAVTEPYYPSVLYNAFYVSGESKIFKEIAEHQTLLPTGDAVIFVDNPEMQRFYEWTLTYKSPKFYKMANVFMLGHPYGTPIIMSSYDFKNENQGPPADEEENIKSPIINEDDSCGGGWICEHRWPQIFKMIDFRRIVGGANVTDDWGVDKYNQLAFSRGDKGFVAINGGRKILNARIQTRLPKGIYCDVISGYFIDGECSGKMIRVDDGGKAKVVIRTDDEEGAIAIHFKAKLSDTTKLNE